jgi:serine/threonine-protein kinase RsbW
VGRLATARSGWVVSMPFPADQGQRPGKITPASGRQVPSVLWWARDFRGDKNQVRPVRHWIEDLLPECEPLDDILLLASEVCTNAIVHTLSGKDGLFSIDVEWSPSLVRVMIGDQGSLKAPAVRSKKDDASWVDEYGRGLWLVSELADAWGTATHLGGRSVWFDIAWQKRGGPLLEAPSGHEAMSTSMTVLRRAWPGTTVWWGHRTKAFWAALPRVTEAEDLISAGTLDALIPVVAERYPAAKPADLASSA